MTFQTLKKLTDFCPICGDVVTEPTGKGDWIHKGLCSHIANYYGVYDKGVLKPTEETVRKLLLICQKHYE